MVLCMIVVFMFKVVFMSKETPDNDVVHFSTGDKGIGVYNKKSPSHLIVVVLFSELCKFAVTFLTRIYLP